MRRRGGQGFWKGLGWRVFRELIEGKAQGQPWLPTVNNESCTGSHKTETDGRPQGGEHLAI